MDRNGAWLSNMLAKCLVDCTVIYAENDIDTYATFIQEFQLQVQFTFRVNYSPLLPKKHHLTIRLTNFKVGEKKPLFANLILCRYKVNIPL